MYKKLSDVPLVTYSGIQPGRWIGAPGLYNGRKLGTRGWYLVSPTWTIESLSTSSRIRQDAILHRLAYPGHRLVFICNTEAETDRMRSLGEAAVFCCKNCLVDPSAFHPLPDTDRKYDAIYNARLEPWKRHELSLSVKSCAFIFYRAANDSRNTSYEQMLVRKHGEQAPGHVFLNEFDFRLRPVRMPMDQVNRHMNEAHVGLCLSAEEGGMLASLEYMLAGLPVVSTRSVGGRDRYFDDEYCAIVDDTPEAVAEAVEALKVKQLDPGLIRSRTLQRIETDREVLRQLINRIFEIEGADQRLEEGWKGTGQPSSLWRYAAQVFKDMHAGPGSNLGRKKAKAPETAPNPEAVAKPVPRARVVERPLISALQMGYNQADQIEPSLRAVLAQTYSPLEVIFSDDCSQDGTFDVMERVAAEYSGPHKIILNRNQKNLGLVGNFNRCVELSSGRLLMQTNGDDISSPERAEYMYRAWAEDPDRIKLIFCNMERTDADGQVVGVDPSTSLETLTPDPLDIVEKDHFVVGSGNTYSRDLFERFGPVPGSALVEDHVLVFRASILGRIAHVPKTLVQWRIGGLSWTDDDMLNHPDRHMFGDRIKTSQRVRANHFAFLEDCERVDFPQKQACVAMSKALIARHSHFIETASLDILSLIARTPLVVKRAVLSSNARDLHTHMRHLFLSRSYHRMLQSHRARLRRSQQ